MVFGRFAIETAPALDVRTPTEIGRDIRRLESKKQTLLEWVVSVNQQIAEDTALMIQREEILRTGLEGRR